MKYLPNEPPGLKTTMRFPNYFRFVFLVFFCALFATQNGEGATASFHSSTALRVLLQRSSAPLSLRIRTPAHIRINGAVQKPQLSAGPVYFGRTGGNHVQMIRIPYKPLTAQSVEMLWPYDKPGLEWEGSEFRGRVLVKQEKGELFAINTVPVEAYLASTVGGEMSPSWKIEALKAQAVAARSYALYRQNHPRHWLYDLDRTTEDQVYLGMKGETARTWEAVRTTVGQYLSQSGKPTLAYYHSRCGGETETAERVWNASQKTGAQVPCPYCRSHPFRWKAAWTPREFLKKLGLPESEFAAIVPIRRSAAGRIYDLEVSNGEEKRRFSADHLRRLLGYTTLKSSTFSVSPTSEQIQAEGVGAGHGVGMCQWGAKYLAEKGLPFEKILSHYYPLHSLKKESLRSAGSAIAFSY